jgi:chromosome segregation ATPase
MIFSLLALVALSFGLLGFLLNSFYFSKHGLLESLKQEIQHLERMLEIREQENANTQQEVEKTGIPVPLLKRHLEEKRNLVNSFQDRAKRQKDQIRLIEKQFPEISLNLDRTEGRRQENPTFKPEESASETVPQTKEQKIPLWKDNLNNILDMLNKIEKEENI